MGDLELCRGLAGLFHPIYARRCFNCTQAGSIYNFMSLHRRSTGRSRMQDIELFEEAAGGVGAGIVNSADQGLDAVAYEVVPMRRADFERAPASMRLRTVQPIATSVCRAPNHRALNRLPMMALYWPIAVSTRGHLPYPVMACRLMRSSVVIAKIWRSR